MIKISECNREDIGFLFKEAYQEGLDFSPTKSKKTWVNVKRNGNIIGFACILHLSDKHARLKNLYVIKTERGKGIGKQLIDYRLKLLKQYKVVDTLTYHPDLYPDFETLKTVDTKRGIIYHMVKRCLRPT